MNSTGFYKILVVGNFSALLEQSEGIKQLFLFSEGMSWESLFLLGSNGHSRRLTFIMTFTWIWGHPESTNASKGRDLVCSKAYERTQRGGGSIEESSVRMCLGHFLQVIMLFPLFLAFRHATQKAANSSVFANLSEDGLMALYWLLKQLRCFRDSF